MPCKNPVESVRNGTNSIELDRREKKSHGVYLWKVRVLAEDVASNVHGKVVESTDAPERSCDGVSVLGKERGQEEEQQL